MVSCIHSRYVAGLLTPWEAEIMGVQITHWDPWRPLRAVALQLRAYVEVCTNCLFPIPWPQPIHVRGWTASTKKAVPQLCA